MCFPSLITKQPSAIMIFIKYGIILPKRRLLPLVNYGDVIFQLLMFIFLIAVISAIVIVIKTVLKKKAPQQSQDIEKKLDRIIELLEKDKNN